MASIGAGGRLGGFAGWGAVAGVEALGGEGGAAAEADEDVVVAPASCRRLLHPFFLD